MPKLDRRFIALGDGPHDLNLELLPDGPTRIALTTENQIISGTKIFTDIPKTAQQPITDSDLTNKAYVDLKIEQIISGTHWKSPVNDVVEILPVIANEGYRVINLTDNKIYTWVNGSWDSGVIPEANWTVLVKKTDEQWTYDYENEEWIIISYGGLPEATKTSYGKVQIGDGLNIESGIVSANPSYGLTLIGETPNKIIGVNHDSSLQVISNVLGIHVKENAGIHFDEDGIYIDYSDLLVEKYETFTVDSIILSNKYIDVSSVIKQDDFTKVQVVGGPILQYNQDFTITSDSFGVTRRIDWNGYGLENMLEEGEVIQIWYITI